MLLIMMYTGDTTKEMFAILINQLSRIPLVVGPTFPKNQPSSHSAEAPAKSRQSNPGMSCVLFQTFLILKLPNMLRSTVRTYVVYIYIYTVL